MILNCLTQCRAKYYNNCLFFKISRNFIAQTGDPKNDGTGGSSVYGCVLTHVPTTIRAWTEAMLHVMLHSVCILGAAEVVQVDRRPIQAMLQG